jgi:hypothetical protein
MWPWQDPDFPTASASPAIYRHTVQVDKSLINERLVFLLAATVSMKWIELNLALENHYGMRHGHFLASRRSNLDGEGATQPKKIQNLW